jgi:glycosyltransferase involved in cell wall biosynthesis
MTYNIHLYPSDFNYEIRIEKEAKAINKLNYFKKIFLLGAGNGNFKIDKNIYVKLFGFENNNKIIGQKIISFIIFYLSVLFFLSNKKVKLINAHSLSVLPLAFLLKIIKGSKLVYDTHELETETDQTNFFRRIIFKYIEKKIIYYCDLIIVVSENIADWYSKEYRINRPLVIKNACYLYKINNKKNYLRKKLKIPNYKKILLYQGDLAKVKGIELIIDAFKKRSIIKKDKLVFVLIGYGELYNKIKKIVKIYKNIYLLKSVPHKKLLNYTSSADLGIMLPKNTCLNNYFCMPNKLFEYAMCGLPVMISNMKEMSEVVNKYKFGIIIKRLSVTSINNVLDKFEIKKNLKELSVASRKFANINSWEKQEKLLIQRYREILN